jgi:Na+-translocating ferredoxin:NAD+ oxidoreductase RnfC subunit
MSLIDKARAAGVAGAGGAGFPTHVKLDCRAEYVIANGAECEPLLRVDQQLMELYAREIAEGLELAVSHVGAKEGVIFLKEHYHEAVKALKWQLRHKKNLRLHLSESYYPAGDEQQIIYEVTRRRVPPGGLPKDVGCVVSNVSTLRDIARAAKDIPVTDRYITVAGAVKAPRTLLAPLGTDMAALVDLAGGPSEPDCVFIIGGPCMGAVAESLDGVSVTKTTGGLLAIPREHPLLNKKNAEIRLRAMLSVCCQCSMCTQMCPRNALGLGTSPHKAMRALAYATDLMGHVNETLTCCDCGVCTYFACNFGLNPALVMKRFKAELSANGLRPQASYNKEPDFFINDKRLSTERLVARLGLREYDVPAPIDTTRLNPASVKIPLKMHIGAPSVPVVTEGQAVQAGALIAKTPEGKLGANVHASIDGAVARVTGEYIEIRK